MYDQWKFYGASAIRGRHKGALLHSAAIVGGNWGFLLLLLIFLSLYTIIEHHNVAQSGVSPQPPSPSHPRPQIASSTAQQNEKHMHNEHI